MASALWLPAVGDWLQAASDSAIAVAAIRLAWRKKGLDMTSSLIRFLWRGS